MFDWKLWEFWDDLWLLNFMSFNFILGILNIRVLKEVGLKTFLHVGTSFGWSCTEVCSSEQEAREFYI